MKDDDEIKDGKMIRFMCFSREKNRKTNGENSSPREITQNIKIFPFFKDIFMDINVGA